MAASTSGLCAEGKPLAGGARFQEGWAVGGLVRNQPPAETKSEPKLVEVPCGASADAGSIPAASMKGFAAQLRHLIQASSDRATLVHDEPPPPDPGPRGARRARLRRC